MREVDLAEPQSRIPWRLRQIAPCIPDSSISLRWYEYTSIYVNTPLFFTCELPVWESSHAKLLRTVVHKS